MQYTIPVPLLRLPVPLLRLSVPLLRLSLPLMRLSIHLLRLSVPLRSRARLSMQYIRCFCPSRPPSAAPCSVYLHARPGCGSDVQPHLALPPRACSPTKSSPLLHTAGAWESPPRLHRSKRGLPLSARARTGSGACGHPTRARRRLRPPTRSVRLPSSARRKWEWRRERGPSKRENAWPGPPGGGGVREARWLGGTGLGVIG